MIIDYFGKENIKLIAEEVELPDRPDRDNVVGLGLDFLLYDEIEFGCGIGMGLNFLIQKVNGQKKLISEGEYMTWDKIESIAFSLTDEVVQEKIEILSGVIDQIRNGEEITKVDIKVSK